MLQLEQTETFRTWRQKLKDIRVRALIAARLSRLEFGHEGDVKWLGQGIGELRIHHGPGYRIYFQKRSAQIILLLCAGSKGSQPRDIEAARKLAKEWREGNE